jgi:hypothetical protein
LHLTIPAAGVFVEREATGEQEAMVEQEATMATGEQTVLPLQIQRYSHLPLLHPSLHP